MELIALGSVFVRSLKVSALSLITISAMSIALAPTAYAKVDDQRPAEQALRGQMFKAKFLEFAQIQAAQMNPLPSMVFYMSDILTDQVAAEILSHQYSRPLFRDELADQAMDVMIREKGK